MKNNTFFLEFPLAELTKVLFEKTKQNKTLYYNLNNGKK